MYPILIVAFLAVISALDTFPLTQDFLLNVTEGAKVFTFQANLKTNTATLTVTSTADLVFCFQQQYSLFTNSTPVISLNSAYWNAQNCFAFAKTNGNGNAQIPLSMVPISVAIMFQNTSSAPANVTLSIAGDVCADNTIGDTGSCVATIEATLGTPIVVPASTPASGYKFRLASTKLTGSFNITCESEHLSYYLALDASPAYGTKHLCNQSTVVEFPRMGAVGYFLLVSNDDNATHTLNITVAECNNDMGGPLCNINITNATAVPDLILIENNIYYFKVDATTVSGVWASVRGVNGTIVNVVNPLIFASLNQLPRPGIGNSDVSVCNQYYCDLVNALHFGLGLNQTWYVGVQNSNNMYNGSKAGVWFNSVCAPGCSDHGECAVAGPQMGFCDCIDGFIGVDCNTANGFGPQFIVLIIIAVLVALTAVIGFGAWAYMRRKRGQYDIVS